MVPVQQNVTVPIVGNVHELTMWLLHIGAAHCQRSTDQTRFDHTMVDHTTKTAKHQH